MQRNNVHYINGIQVNASMYDFCIDCFNTAMDDDDKQPNVTLVMSPQHFKKMCFVLNGLLQDYEKNAGIIDLPDESAFK